MRTASEPPYLSSTTLDLQARTGVCSVERTPAPRVPRAPSPTPFSCADWALSNLKYIPPTAWHGSVNAQLVANDLGCGGGSGTDVLAGLSLLVQRMLLSRPFRRCSSRCSWHPHVHSVARTRARGCAWAAYGGGQTCLQHPAGNLRLVRKFERILAQVDGLSNLVVILSILSDHWLSWRHNRRECAYAYEHFFLQQDLF